jgi:hypothetical protein
MPDLYYVCTNCAHTWSEPDRGDEWPDWCENCRKPATFLEQFSSLGAAEDYSQDLIDRAVS